MRDLINAGIEFLLKSKVSKYCTISRHAHTRKDQLVPILKDIEDNDNYQGYKVVVQSLFESGFLSEGDADFNCDIMFEYIYGTKMYSSLSAFLELFDMLMEGGYTSNDNSYNPSGDNFYHALKYQMKPDENDMILKDLHASQGKDVEDVEFREDVLRKVIVIENQSPMWAVVVDYSIYTNDPRRMHFVRLKNDYNDPHAYTDMVDIEFDVADQFNLSAFGSESRINKIITTLDIDNMSAKPILTPKIIEHVLFNIYSGRDSLKEDTK